MRVVLHLAVLFVDLTQHAYMYCDVHVFCEQIKMRRHCYRYPSVIIWWKCG